MRALPILAALVALPIAPHAADLAMIIRETGCHSPYSDEKKANLFEKSYKGRLVRASGEIVRLDKDSLGLRVERASLFPDVEITLKVPGSGYDLRKNSQVKVTFRLTDQGGCILPYWGDLGEVR